MILLLVVIIVGVILAFFMSKNIVIDNHIVELMPHDAFSNLNKPDTLVIDVREKDEYASGHLNNSVNIPLSILRESYKLLSNDKSIILVCRSGKRSLSALSFLKDQGFDNLANLKGGIIAWQKSGFNLIIDDIDS